MAFLAGSLAFSDTLSANFDRLFSTATAGTSAVVRSSTSIAQGPGGARPPIPAALVGAVRAAPGVADAQPSITGRATLLGAKWQAMRGRGPRGQARTAFPTRRSPRTGWWRGARPRGMHEVVVDRGAAVAGGLSIGSSTTVLTPSPVRVTVVGIAAFGTADSFGGATYTGFSLAAARRYLTRTPDRVSAIEVRAADGVSPAAVVARLDAILPPGVQAITAARLTQTTLTDLNSAFLSTLRVFLDVFAGIALLVAAFSIASTFGIIVAQRTRESALARAVGATRRQIFAGVLAEAVAIGLVRSGLGLAAGFGVASCSSGCSTDSGSTRPPGGW